MLCVTDTPAGGDAPVLHTAARPGLPACRPVQTAGGRPEGRLPRHQAGMLQPNPLNTVTGFSNVSEDMNTSISWFL